MIGVTPRLALQEVAVRLQARLGAPDDAVARRVAELGLLAALLDEQFQDPEQLPYVDRAFYDAERPRRSPNAPSSRTLTERYGGSWKRACWAAYGLMIDGRSRAGGLPWATTFPGDPGPKAYTRDDAINALRRCVGVVGRRPSAADYNRWRLNVKERARRRGHSERLPAPERVIQLLAPDHERRRGWTISLAVAFKPNATPDRSSG